MRILFGWLTLLFLAGCTRPALHHASVAPPGDAPFTAASVLAAPTTIPSGSTAAGAATYRAVTSEEITASTGTAALPVGEAFRPRPLSANGSDRKAASGTAFTIRKKAPAPARVRQPRQGKPDQDTPAKARLNRLSLLSVLAGVAAGVLILVQGAVTGTIISWTVPLWLLLGLAAIILGVRGANTLKARGEKGSFLSFIGILLGGIVVTLSVIVGLVALLNYLLPG